MTMDAASNVNLEQMDVDATIHAGNAQTTMHIEAKGAQI